jgi:DNA invertase Pin-like site-specific DNA recombinase
MLAQLDTSRLALVYPRQSSGQQLKENIYSLENQMKLVDQAHRDGFEPERVLLIDEDLGKSARTIDKRVGMVKALDLIDRGLVAALYAEDQTRLSRDVDTIDHMIIAKRCRLAGVPMFYGGSWRDMSDRGTRIAYKVEAVIGSEMWGLHQDKMYQALKAKAANGQAVCQVPQYGYRVRKGLARKDPLRDTLAIDPEEAAIIRALADQLEAVGSLRQLSRKIQGARWPNGKPITFGHLQKIFKKPVFRGHYEWGSVLVENVHEAIITPEQGARIDELLAGNKATLRRPSEVGAALVGRVWCQDCARRMTTASTRSASAYQCKSGGPVDAPQVHFQVSADMLDALVLNHLWERLEAGMIGDIIAHLKGTEARRAQTVDLKDGAARSLQRKIEGLTASLCIPDMPEAARRVLILQLDEVARELDAVNVAPRSVASSAQDIAFFEDLQQRPEFLLTLLATWEAQPLIWRRRFLRRFVEQVDVSCIRRGEYLFACRLRDGSELKERLQTRIEVTEVELDLIRVLWQDDARPTWGRTVWVQEKLAAAGYPREISNTLRVIAMAIPKGQRKRGT